jgi:alkanesulfonate monooxygenase SsuD/methylene tetrahydromethanopterin reductase-like flavin-dependent oxidoreductase (luciferase family)
MSVVRTTAKFDMRAPAFGRSPAELYAAALDMCGYLDEIGVGRINVMEHHGFEDNYLPQPFLMGSAIATRTRRCRIMLGAVILPLHDPVKVAEQIAVLDLISGGRLEVIFGAGYVKSEFDMFGVSMKDRGGALDEGVEVILRALAGERFTCKGRPVFVRPLPIQKPEDIILVGGGVEASARRAARFGVGLAPMRAGLSEVYEEECRRLGREPRTVHEPTGLGDIHLTHDVEASWTKVMPHLKHAVGDYARIAEESGADSPFRGLLTNEAALKACGIFHVWTPEETVEKAKGVGPRGSLTFMPLIGGLDPDVGWESLRLLKDVMPKLAAREPATA